METKLMFPAITWGRYMMMPDVGNRSRPTEEFPIEAI